MPERITTEEIEKMILLYDKYGNYARVGREMGRAASTVVCKGKADIFRV